MPLTELRLGVSKKWTGARSILRNGIRMMSISWAEAGLGAAYLAVMARSIGPVLYGRWAYGIASYTLLVGLLGSFDMLMLLRLGRDKWNAGGFIGLTLLLRIALLALGSCGLAIYALTAETDKANALVMLLLVPALFGRGVALWVRMCFLGYERIAEYARFAVLCRIGEAACAIVYLAAGGGLFGIVALHSFSWLFEASLGVLRVRRQLTAFSLRFDLHAAAELIAQGAILGLATGGYAWLAAGPIIMLRRTHVAMGQVGEFAIVLSLTMVLVGSAESFASSVLPKLSRSQRRIEVGVNKGYGRLTAVALAVAALCASAIGWVAGPAAAGWVLGNRYALTGALLAPLALIGGTILLPIGYFHALLASNQRWPEAIANVWAGLLMAVALWPAVAAWGIDGAVGTTAAAWVLRAVILIAWGEAGSVLGYSGRIIAALWQGGDGRV